jgi:imidazoleglycerol-phosphate dehydratase
MAAVTAFQRETRETRVRVALEPAPGEIRVATGEAFLDHMLATLARYAGWTLSVEARGDLRHHLIEDVAITLGAAVRQAFAGPRARYGHRVIPMDDALVEVALDFGGRAYYQGPLPSSLYDHWMRSFATEAALTLHVCVRRGRDRHHVIEAAFKALGLALRAALVAAADEGSTKGAVRWEPPAC